MSDLTDPRFQTIAATHLKRIEDIERSLALLKEYIRLYANLPINPSLVAEYDLSVEGTI